MTASVTCMPECRRERYFKKSLNFAPSACALATLTVNPQTPRSINAILPLTAATFTALNAWQPSN